MRIWFFCFLLSTMLVAPSVVFGSGAHDSLSCTGCHSIHDAQGNLIFAVKPNAVDKNPLTGKSYGGITALCLGCHDSVEKGGMGVKPIYAHKSHPFGINKINNKVANVPKDLLREGRFECVSCHDPHPSNPNYKYLRIDTKNGSRMESFCSLCHPAKTDPKSRVGMDSVFTSMDETKVSR
ncbi:MAG: cytochrome C [Nitrospirae bacterium]|nr:MAG: cytochrome C [Nitrospirota bacterium]